MKTHTYRPKPKQGFSLIEILVVVTIIALLIAILIPVTSRMLTVARLNATVADIRNLSNLAGDAASRLGGTLPLTEGITATNLADLPISATLLTWLGGANNIATRLNNLNALVSLDNVFMSMKPSMMDNYYRSPLGLSVKKSQVDPPLRYDSESGRYDCTPLTVITARYTASDGFGDSGRIECTSIIPAFNPSASSVNVAGGINFLLDGVNSLPAGRCVYMVYELVPIGDAYELSKRMNPPQLLNSQVFNRNPQLLGRVIYQGNGPSTRVYVYLANF